MEQQDQDCYMREDELKVTLAQGAVSQDEAGLVAVTSSAQ